MKFTFTPFKTALALLALLPLSAFAAPDEHLRLSNDEFAEYVIRLNQIP